MKAFWSTEITDPVSKQWLFYRTRECHHPTETRLTVPPRGARLRSPALEKWRRRTVEIKRTACNLHSQAPGQLGLQVRPQGKSKTQDKVLPRDTTANHAMHWTCNHTYLVSVNFGFLLGIGSSKTAKTSQTLSCKQAAHRVSASDTECPWVHLQMWDAKVMKNGVKVSYI